MLDRRHTTRRDAAPLVSVVIPSYNHRAYVESALESIFVQTYPSIEIIVIDDGSSDDSATRIRSTLCRSPFPWHFYARENCGAAGTINEAVASSKGEFVNVLNSDDRFAPSRLMNMVDAVARSGEKWGFSRVAFMDGDGEAIGAETSPRAADLAYLTDNVSARDTVGSSFLSGNPSISSGTLFFARTLFDRIGGFRDFRYNHDWDFCLRATLIAEPVFVHELPPACPERRRFDEPIRSSAGNLGRSILRADPRVGPRLRNPAGDAARAGATRHGTRSVGECLNDLHRLQRRRCAQPARQRPGARARLLRPADRYGHVVRGHRGGRRRPQPCRPNLR
jgi:glycosyltransferase involved in cell wall biosynthesis